MCVWGVSEGLLAEPPPVVRSAVLPPVRSAGSGSTGAPVAGTSLSAEEGQLTGHSSTDTRWYQPDGECADGI